MIHNGGDKWSIQRFCNYSRSVEAHNCHSDQRETGTQIGKTKNHIDIKSENLLAFFTKTANQMLKNGKYANCVNTKTEKLKFFDTTIEKPILKIVKTAKVKIPMPPTLDNGDQFLCS